MLNGFAACLLLAMATPPVSAVCPAWPKGVSVFAPSGQALAFAGDFDADGNQDMLEVVAITKTARLPGEWDLGDPWRGRLSAPRPTGDAVALAITRGTPESRCMRALLTTGEFFATPRWRTYLAHGPQGPAALSVARAGTRKHAVWKRTVPGLKGDAVELGTEAGIDVLLYWDGHGFAVFWPQEAP